MQVRTWVSVRELVCAKQRQCVDDILNKKNVTYAMCVKRSHGREISIELKTWMKCVAARSIKSAIEFVFATSKIHGSWPTGI